MQASKSLKKKKPRNKRNLKPLKINRSQAPQMKKLGLMVASKKQNKKKAINKKVSQKKTKAGQMVVSNNHSLQMKKRKNPKLLPLLKVKKKLGLKLLFKLKKQFK